MKQSARCGWMWLVTHAADCRSSFSFELVLPQESHSLFFTFVITFNFLQFLKIQPAFKNFFVFCPVLFLVFGFMLQSGFHIFTCLFDYI